MDIIEDSKEKTKSSLDFDTKFIAVGGVQNDTQKIHKNNGVNHNFLVKILAKFFIFIIYFVQLVPCSRL